MRSIIGIAVLLAGVACNDVLAQEFPGSGRLKFKQGPVCMCDKGLTEKDIREAQKSRNNSSGVDSLQRINQNDSSQKVERRSDEEE